MNKCLTTGCEGEVVYRGVCKQCRNSFRQHIKMGRATDDQLVAVGMMLPPSRSKASSERSQNLLAEFQKRMKLQQAGFDPSGKLKTDKDTPTDKPKPAPKPSPKPVKAPTEEQIAKRLEAAKPRWMNTEEEEDEDNY